MPDFAAFYIQEIGAMLFGLVFLFLYRQSRVVYFWPFGRSPAAALPGG